MSTFSYVYYYRYMYLYVCVHDIVSLHVCMYFLCMYTCVSYLTIIILCRHHAWTSFQASAEIYNELIRSTDNQNAKNLCKFFKDGSNCLNGEGKD